MTKPAAPATAERVQKLIARAGAASRREAEELIKLGEVTINGKMAKPGDTAVWGKDSIKVRGKLLHALEAPVYYLFHKPRGVLSTVVGDDEKKRPTLLLFLSRVREKVMPIGRLDFNTEGLVLLTNDGPLGEKLLKSKNIVRTFHVKVKKHPLDSHLRKLEAGMRLDGRTYTPKAVKVVKKLENKAMIEIQFSGLQPLKLKEYFEKKGLLTERVICAGFGPYKITGLPAGEMFPIPRAEALKLI